MWCLEGNGEKNQDKAIELDFALWNITSEWNIKFIKWEIWDALTQMKDI